MGIAAATSVADGGLDESDCSAATPRLRITEVFHSLQGEADAIGWPTVFVRLTGCPLRCSWCDTTYSFTGGEAGTGDKGAAAVVDHKVARWLARGVAFVSVDYRLLPQAGPLQQAQDVARALATAQAHAAEWGADPARFVLMGHSAGAHLVSLVNADASIRRVNAVQPLLGVVSLDAGAIDVVRQMPNVYPFLEVRYREAFGDTESAWIAASPFHQIDRTAAPWLGVCSTARKDEPCGQAQAYAVKSNDLGIRAQVLPQRKSHGEINAELGTPGDYTRAVEAFMASLDPAVARRLR